MSNESLCFLQARHALKGYTDPKGRKWHISEEQWMWHLVQHIRGIRHQLCSPRLEPMTSFVDPVGHSVSKIALKDGYEALKEEEAGLYEKLLIDSLHGNLNAVETSFDPVKQLREPHLDPLLPVDTVGAFKGHLEILKFALEKGAEMNRDLALAIKKGSEKSEEMGQYYTENKARIDDLPELKSDLRKGRTDYDVYDTIRRVGEIVKW